MGIKSEFTGTKRFQLQRQLGSGGFGSVYQVFDQERKTIVALKTLHQTDAESLYRFKQEFRTLADIHHHNLVSLYELMSDEDQWFFTMELVQGVNFLEYLWNNKKGLESIDSIINANTVRVAEGEEILTQKNPGNTLQHEKTLTQKQISSQDFNIISQKMANESTDVHFLEFSLDEGRLRSALRQLAEGLFVLHEAGKLHRDLKPSNVLITPQGRVVILDLGLAVEIAGKGIHESMNIVGTPAYMSPEQGSKSSVSKASDWYSVGVILYEALTGRTPFTGSILDILINRQTTDPVAPSELVKNVPVDLNQLCQELLSRDPALRPSGDEVLRRLGKDEQSIAIVVSSGARNTTLSGRQTELAALMDAFQTVQAGNAVTVYLPGRAGIGKTALINYFIDELQSKEQNLVVLLGRCYGQENLPYKALDSVIDALSQYLKRLPTTEVEALLPRDMAVLARLFPVLKPVLAATSIRQRLVDIPNVQELRRRAFSALRELLARLADKRDLVIFIDDLQWGDVDSGVLLSELLRPPEAPEMLLIASYRIEDKENSLLLKHLFNAQFMAATAIDTREIAIKELSLSSAKELALSLLSDKQPNAKKLAEIIAEESKGIPLLIDELARYSRIDDELISSIGENSLSESGFSLIKRVVKQRVLQLPKDARRLLELVAIADQPIERQIVKKAIKLDSHEQEAFSLLRVGRLIRVISNESGEKLVPYHEGVRETVISQIKDLERVEYHKDLAMALETPNELDAKSLAIHFNAAGEVEKALHYTIVAAEEATKALAFDNAARFYKMALGLNPKEKEQQLQVKLGDALANAGRGAEAAQAYLIAAKTAASTDAIELERRAAEQFLINGYIKEGISVLRKVLAKVDIKLPETTQGALLSYLFTRFQVWLRGLGFKERAEKEVDSKELLRIDVCWSAIVGLAYVNTKRAIDFQARHLLMALNAGEPYRVARALALEIGHSATEGSRNQVFTNQLCHQALVLAKKINHPHTTALSILETGFAAYMQGNWIKSYQMFTKAEPILQEQCTNVTWEMDTAHYFLVRTLLFLGKITELTQQLSTFLKDAQERGDLFAATNLRIWSHMVFLAADEPEEASKEIEAAMASWVRKSFDLQHYWRLYTEVEIDLYQNNFELAWQRIQKIWPVLSSSFFLRTQIIAIESFHLRARTALALATQAQNSQQDPNKYLTIAEKDAKRIYKEKATWGNALASLVLASIADIRGQKEQAINYLVDAEVGFETTQMELYLAVCLYRRSQLIETSEKEALQKRSMDWFAKERFVDAEKIINMSAPGQWKS